jgi:hypothetical protein
MEWDQPRVHGRCYFGDQCELLTCLSLAGALLFIQDGELKQLDVKARQWA